MTFSIFSFLNLHVAVTFLVKYNECLFYVHISKLVRSGASNKSLSRKKHGLAEHIETQWHTQICITVGIVWRTCAPKETLHDFETMMRSSKNEKQRDVFRSRSNKSIASQHWIPSFDFSLKVIADKLDTDTSFLRHYWYSFEIVF